MNPATMPRPRLGSPLGTCWFRIGDGFLGLTSVDREFGDRVAALFLECIIAPPAPGDPAIVTCDVREGDRGQIRIVFADAEPFDDGAVARAMFPELDLRDAAPPSAGVVVAKGWPGRIAFTGSGILADRAAPWQTIAIGLALFRVQRLQRHVLFFHAASVAVGGRGLLLLGPKGAGKTTLALAVADRGHVLLGDETAALRTATMELLPVRRRLSIRPGPGAAGVARAIAGAAWPVVTLADGSSRTRVQPAALLGPVPGEPVRAAAAVFLGPQGPALRLRPFVPDWKDVGRLQPYESATWRTTPAAVAVRLLSVLGAVRCYTLDPGPVDVTARALVDLLEDA